MVHDIDELHGFYRPRIGLPFQTFDIPDNDGTRRGPLLERHADRWVEPG